MSGLFPNNKWLYMVYYSAKALEAYTTTTSVWIRLSSRATYFPWHYVSQSGTTLNRRRWELTKAQSNVWKKSGEFYQCWYIYTRTYVHPSYVHTHTHIHTHHIDRHSCVDIAYLSIHDLSVVIMTNWLIRLTTKPCNQVPRTPRGGYLFVQPQAWSSGHSRHLCPPCCIE